jgi:N-acyl-D-aspartate/D-glutamate deacylase
MHQVLRGATVVDGTGGPARRADVEVREGTIAATGALGKVPGAEEVDLSGLHLAPGFIDVHTHFDAQAFWDPDFTPSVWHGVTTAIQGNCGFGIAPVRPSERELIVETLAHVEGMSHETLREGVQWSFESFPEYLQALRGRPKRLNLAAYIPHTPLRIFAMGFDAASTRAATPEEVEVMRTMVKEAMTAGAVGLSTSLAPSHQGAMMRPVPSRLAGVEELVALLRAVVESGRGIGYVTYGPELEIEDVARLSKELPLRMSWGSLLTNLFGERGAALERLERATAVGGDIWPQVSARYITTIIHFHDALRLFSALPSFQAAINASTPQEREAIYRDPSWRDWARAETHTDMPGYGAWRMQTVSVDETVKHADLRGRPLHQVAAERRMDTLDLMLDLALEENLETRFRGALNNADPVELRQLLADPRTLLGAHDAGAHVNTLCDACYPSYVLGHWVRDEQAMSLEQAVYKLSAQPADVFGLSDRGRIAPGLVADLVAFDPATVDALHYERLWDFPANGDRIVSRNVGTYGVWVNGECVRRDGEDIDGAYPGRMVAPAPRT